MWEAIGYVTSGVTLAAFLAAVAAWIYRHKLVEQERLIKAALFTCGLEFTPQIGIHYILSGVPQRSGHEQLGLTEWANCQSVCTGRAFLDQPDGDALRLEQSTQDFGAQIARDFRKDQPFIIVHIIPFSQIGSKV